MLKAIGKMLGFLAVVLLGLFSLKYLLVCWKRALLKAVAA